MGVYIFRCKHGPWIKVGHHRVTPRRPNVFFRVARRGFYSCIHPTELKGRLSMEDVELVAWYPTLGRREERALHRLSRLGSVGEFHRLSDLDKLLQCADRIGARAPVSNADRLVALRWSRASGGNTAQLNADATR